MSSTQASLVKTTEGVIEDPLTSICHSTVFNAASFCMISLLMFTDLTITTKGDLQAHQLCTSFCSRAQFLASTLKTAEAVESTPWHNLSEWCTAATQKLEPSLMTVRVSASRGLVSIDDRTGAQY